LQSEGGLDVADVASAIGPGAEEFGTQAQIQSEIAGSFPIILSKQSEIVLSVVVIEDAAAAETEGRSSEQKVLPIGVAVGGVDEEQLAVEHLREKLIEIDEVEFATEAHHVRAMDPGDGIEKRVVVLFVCGIGLRRGADLETGTG
jgi:hypothetical protein